MPEFETICPGLDLLGTPPREPYHQVLVLRAFQPWQKDLDNKLVKALGLVGLGRDHFVELFDRPEQWEDKSSEDIREEFNMEVGHQIIYAYKGEAMLRFMENQGVYLTPGSLAIIPGGTSYCWDKLGHDFKFRFLRLG